MRQAKGVVVRNQKSAGQVDIQECLVYLVPQDVIQRDEEGEEKEDCQGLTCLPSLGCAFLDANLPPHQGYNQPLTHPAIFPLPNKVVLIESATIAAQIKPGLNALSATFFSSP